MWSLVVVGIMASLIGVYASFDKNNSAIAAMPKSAPIAESMAIYREAVLAYVGTHPGFTGNVSLSTLQATNSLPSWSSLATATTAIWQNYRDPAGIVYVYASPLPPANITADILKLAQNSVNAGVYRAGDTTLFSPVVGNTNIKLPTAVSIPDGSPVWVAMK